MHGPKFNLFFDKTNGYYERWGKTTANEDDPIWCEIGPTICDIELSRDILPEDEEFYKNEIKEENHTCLGKCPMCYKQNGIKVTHTHFMTLIKYKYILMQLANTHVRIRK